MICNKCGEDEKIRGRTVTIYYGKIVREETKNYNTLTSTKTVQKTYYKTIKNEAINICGECLTAHRKRKLITLPLKWLIPLSPYIIISIFSKTFGAFYVFGAIMLLVIIYSAVSLLKKKHEQKPDKYDAYYLAKKLLKKKLKKANPKDRYDFWREYPKNLTQVRY